MRNKLFYTILALILVYVAKAQPNTCRVDTIYNYKFIDGSTTKTLTGRRIHFGPEIIGGEGGRSAIGQAFKNGSYVNNWKAEYVLHQPSGSYSEYLYSEWDSATASWKPQYKENVTYNANNQLTEFITQRPNQAGTLENQYRTTSTYNAKGRTTSDVSYMWVNGVWRNTNRTTNTYQSDTLITLEQSQTWDTTSSTWVDVQKTERIFDANANEINTYTFSWDGKLSNWKGLYGYNKIYNQQGFLIQSENLFWDSNIQAFSKSSKSIFVINNAGLLLSDTFQTWNSSSGAYVIGQVSAYTYNTNNIRTSFRTSGLNTTTGAPNWVKLSTTTLDASDRPLVIFEQDSGFIAGGSWKPSSRITYTYDANGNNTNYLSEARPAGSETLVNASRSTRTYNTNNEELSFLHESWIAASSVWAPSSAGLNEYDNDGFLTARETKYIWSLAGGYFIDHNRYEYICTPITSGVEPATNKSINVYPNPVTMGNTLSIESNIASDYLLFDYYGRTVKSGNLSAGINTMETLGLSSGFYFLKLNNSTHKIIIQKSF